MISGYPSSGKTYRSRQLLDFFRSRVASSLDPRINRISIHHVNDQILGLDRDVYGEAKMEKNARAEAYSAVERLLGREAIVVADGLNYIKGFRYQLYCGAKAARTPSCVSLEIHVGTPIDKCREINDRLLAEGGADGGYKQDVFDNLVFRYEEPNGMTRWDSPLFTVPFDDEAPPYEAIWDAIIGSEGNIKTAKPNLATVMVRRAPQQHFIVTRGTKSSPIKVPATESDYLYELDNTTQNVINVVLGWQKDHPGEGGGHIATADGIVELSANPVTLPQLQRIRRQFMALNRQHKLPKERIRSSFVEYLNDNIG
ncbi:MAG: hypothetical protein Q9163_006354 [Psora crenata]